MIEIEETLHSVTDWTTTRLRPPSSTQSRARVSRWGTTCIPPVSRDRKERRPGLFELAELLGKKSVSAV